jgi:hypothetical protein
VPQDEVVSLVLENEHGRFEFVNDSATGWKLIDIAPGEVLNESSIQTLVNRATSVSLLRPLGTEALDAYGMDEPSATVTLVTEGEEGETKTYTLNVGAKDPEDNSFVITSSESPYYVRVSEWTVNDFVDKVREDLLVQPTPSPEMTPEG